MMESVVLGVSGRLPGGLSAVAVVCIVAAFALAALAQALSGFGFSLLSIPLLTLVISRIDAIVGGSFVSLVTQSVMAIGLRHDADSATVQRMLPAALLGMPVGLGVAHLVDESALRAAVGIAVLVAVAAIAKGLEFRWRAGIVDRFAGVLSGVLSMTTGTNGPPLVIALAGRSMLAGASRATLTTIFFFTNVVSIVLFALDGSIHTRALVVAAIGIVPALATRALAEPLFHRLDQRRYRDVVLVLLTIAGLVAIVNSVR